MTERIRNKNLQKKVVSPEKAAEIVKDGMTIAGSGGRLFFDALAERGKRGEVKDINFWSQAPIFMGFDSALLEAGILKRRLGSVGNPNIRKAINSGLVANNDMRPEIWPQMIRSGALGKLDIAVVDAMAITEDGHIVPTLGVADGATYAELADMVVVHLNTSLPPELEGIHDVYTLKLPPYQREVPLYNVSDRIGTPYIPAGEDRIVCIIESSTAEMRRPNPPQIDEDSKRLAQHLVNFFEKEVVAGRMPKNLRPFEIGLGATADAIMKLLGESQFEDLEVYTAVLSDGVFEAIESGKCRFATGTGMGLSEENWKKFSSDIEKYKKKIVLRGVEVTNNWEVLRRLGVIALNGILEADIYGNINSSHIMGTNLQNGVGGTEVFAAPSPLSVFLTMSTGREGTISSIVPMTPHVDISEHLVDVIVTEQGLADLRGLSPVERAEKIIGNCAHPDYRPLLFDYLERAKKEGGHEPHILEEALSFHLRFKKTKTMKIS
ncbi:MAG: acetyl-CoA hydrolase/transferase C-terminal domain-containing protein [Thermodesulfobacteriota bacterium]|nr:acetyl-CoA hydrolase/transferase C-terminal domain-containing protein [Thermodesulfobacteriota bacterium]